MHDLGHRADSLGVWDAILFGAEPNGRREERKHTVHCQWMSINFARNRGPRLVMPSIWPCSLVNFGEVTCISSSRMNWRCRGRPEFLPWMESV